MLSEILLFMAVILVINLKNIIKVFKVNKCLWVPLSMWIGLVVFSTLIEGGQDTPQRKEM